MAVQTDQTVGTLRDEVHMEDEPETRGARVRYAMDGLQRFKQSWYSVMVLKAGIGFDQVSRTSDPHYIFLRNILMKN